MVQVVQVMLTVFIVMVLYLDVDMWLLLVLPECGRRRVVVVHFVGFGCQWVVVMRYS